MASAFAIHHAFRLVERPYGDAWLHQDAPVWVVRYEGVPGSQTHRYDSWQAYRPRAGVNVPEGRDPWTVDNRMLGPEGGFPTPEQAFRAALDAIAEGSAA